MIRTSARSMQPATRRRAASWSPVLLAFVLAVAACSATTGARDTGATSSQPDARDAGAQDAAAEDVTAPSDAGVPDVVRASHRDIPGYDPAHRVGSLYFVIHVAPTYASVATHSSLTIEQALRTGTAMDRFYDGQPDNGLSVGYLYHEQPDLGFYCLFEPGDEAGFPADQIAHANHWVCPTAAATVAENHARRLVAAGIDYVVIDLSNNIALDAGTLLLALRPTAILFREWDRLRARGVPTPQIAIWAPVPAGSTLWQRYLALYDQYPDLALTHEGAGTEHGRKVWFYVEDGGARQPDPGILNQIFEHGGARDVRPVPMWTQRNGDGTYGSSYRWAFMSPCMDGGQPTTSILGATRRCQQPWTTASTIGSAVTVGPSYQNGYASLPFESAGKLRGLTLKRQFERAFEVHPAYLLISGWNEHASGHWSPHAYSSLPDVYASGFEYQDLALRQFIDGYGAEYTRDIEPTVESGTLLYDVLRSCLQRYRTGACTAVGGQDCCNLATDFVNVYSLAATHDTRHVVTVTAAEAATLRAGGAYRNVCTRFNGPTEFCVDASEPDRTAGPFIAFGNAHGSERVPVYRCHAPSDDRYFLSIAPRAECAAPLRGGDAPLFYVAAQRSSETPRALRRCYDGNHGTHSHAVGLVCPAGTADAPVFGFVR